MAVLLEQRADALAAEVVGLGAGVRDGEDAAHDAGHVSLVMVSRPPCPSTNRARLAGQRPGAVSGGRGSGRRRRGRSRSRGRWRHCTCRCRAIGGCPPSPRARRRPPRRCTSNGFRSSTPVSRYVVRNFPSASSREKPSAVCVRSFVPNEQKSACSAISSARTHARGQLDHRPDQVVELALRGRDEQRQLPQPAELLAEADERMHDLDERRVARPLADGDRRAHDRPHLHLVDLGIHQPEPAAAGAEHRVRLVQRP